MAGNERVEDSIGRWLEEAAPTRLPGRVLDATFERTRRTRQEPAWRTVLRRPQTPRFIPALGTAAVVVMAAVLALNFIPLFGPGGPPTPSPSATASPSTSPPPSATPPPSEAQVTELLNGFLEARVAGEGAQQYLNVPGEDIPLLYATTSGAPYERAEFERVRGTEWPYGWIAFKVRLFAGDTVVEQLFFTPTDGRLALEYQPDGFGTDIAPTTEDGQPVAAPYNYFDGEVTLHAGHPWVFGGGGGRLIPEGPGVGPTTDGGERREWDRLALVADPAVAGTDCQTGAGPADAEALAESIRSYPDLEATAPVAVSSGGAEALMMDVVTAAGATMTVAIDENGNLCDHGVLSLVFDQDAILHMGSDSATGRATGDRMRLYLFDVPEGSSMRILAMAIIAPESRFERAVEAAAPVVDSVEFHAP